MLSFPNPPHYAIIDATDLQPSTKGKYKSAIDQMLDNGIDPSNRPALSSYAQSLPLSSRSFLKAALRLLFTDIQTGLEASASPDNLHEVQARLLNINAMMKSVTVKKPEGSKTHIWLSREQVEQITALPDLTTIRGLRDYVVLSVLLGAGLRREELETLTFDSLMQQPSKTGLRDVLAITGKGGKRRTVPISAKLARHLRSWKEITGEGYVARSINKSGVVNGSLSAVSIHRIVRQYGSLIGVPELDAHDMRRSFARIGYDSGVPVEQISKLLGHANIKTTMLYLGIDIDLTSTVSDFIPLAGD